jgi:hypothetical protein
MEFYMNTNETTTLIKMLDSLPEHAQQKAIEHLRDYIAETHEEIKWEESYKNTSDNLEKYAQKVKNEISAGKAKTMDFTKL